MWGRDRPTARRGLSEEIATALILAIIVLAFVVTSGLWFGTLGSHGTGRQPKPSDIQVDEAVVPAAIGQGAPYIFCSAEAGTSLSAYIHLQNAGTATATAKNLEIDYAGTTIPVALESSCSIPAGTGLYLVILSLPFQPTAGEKYTGQVSFSDGAQVGFDGSFM